MGMLGNSLAGTTQSTMAGPSALSALSIASGARDWLRPPTLQVARQVPGEAGHEIGAARPGCSATDAKPTGELCLARCREHRPFFVAGADPFDIAVADCVGERIKRIADNPEHVRKLLCRDGSPANPGASLTQPRIKR